MSQAASKYNTVIDKIREIPFDKVPEREQHNFNLLELDKANVVSIENVPYLIEDKYTYEDADGWEWFEFRLFNLENGDTAFIEVEDDDGLVIYFSHKKISVSEIGKDKLKNIESLDNIRINGEDYYYEDDYSVSFTDHSKDKKVDAYVYEFESSSGENFAAEFWGENEGSAECWLSTKLSEHSVNVIA